MWLFLKKFWYLLVIAALLIFIGFSGMISKCQDEHVEVVVEHVDVSKIRQQLTDSLNTVHANKQKQLLDSANRVNQKKVDKLKTEVADLENTLIAELAEYDQDTAAQSEACNKIIKTTRLVIDKLYEEVRLVSDINKNLKLKIEVDSVEYLGCKTSLNLAYKDIGRLEKIISVESNWWHKNNKYVYYGAGVATTIAIIKIISVVIK